jgi:valyl-tRNA synthetase
LGDVVKEKARKEKELGEKEQALLRANEKLANPRFVSSAPEAVRRGVEKQRDDLQSEVLALRKYLEGLS